MRVTDAADGLAVFEDDVIVGADGAEGWHMSIVCCLRERTSTW